MLSKGNERQKSQEEEKEGDVKRSRLTLESVFVDSAIVLIQWEFRLEAIQPANNPYAKDASFQQFVFTLSLNQLFPKILFVTKQSRSLACLISRQNALERRCT